MQESDPTRSPKVVAQELGISTTTLRRWSDEFTEYLSADAAISNGRGQRRYMDDDLATLILIKELMNEGLTYEQVRKQLNGRGSDGTPPEIIHNPADFDEEDFDFKDEIEKGPSNTPVPDKGTENQPMGLVASGGGESPAIAFLTNTLATLSDSQKSILNSQAANRELLGVLLQDNFNLKEENNRLRERILEVERDVAKNRQDEEWRRESLRQELEAKITSTNQLALNAITTAQSIEIPEIKTVETKPGCLGMLFGRGATQVITTSPSHKRKEGGKPDTPIQPGASSPNYPKPMFPPE